MILSTSTVPMAGHATSIALPTLPLLLAAGLSILKQGGNAADAAAAALLALSVTDFGYFAIGAEIPLIIYDARKKEVKVLEKQKRHYFH